MSDLTNVITDILTVNGVAYPILREAWNYVKYRRKRKDSLEESVRKDLWNEIANLRAALREASATLVDWQARYLELLSQHKGVVEQLAETQSNFVKLGALLNSALYALDKIEEVERHIDELSTEEAKAEIELMRKEAENIKQKAAVLYQS